MRIALDYDETYTLDKGFWGTFINYAKLSGHDIRIVTARDKNIDTIKEDLGIEVIYCNGVAKRYYVERNTGFRPDIWIDDCPENIINNSTYTEEELYLWRKERGIL
jgi:hydroxymethylpyrimidine pyrophosphatase-like HAD family hydrolase